MERIVAGSLQDIFEHAVALHGEDRAAYLLGACETDAQLRAEVDGLLRAHERAAGFLSSPTADHAASAAQMTTPSPVREEPASRIGPYKLLQQIGKGGFGVVFMAQQERPVVRRVALKIIKLGKRRVRRLARGAIAEPSAVVRRDALQKRARIGSAGHQPVVQLDDDQRRPGDPFGIG